MIDGHSRLVALLLIPSLYSFKLAQLVGVVINYGSLDPAQS